MVDNHSVLASCQEGHSSHGELKPRMGYSYRPITILYVLMGSDHEAYHILEGIFHIPGKGKESLLHFGENRPDIRCVVVPQ